MLIPWGEYRPDVSDYEGQHSKNLLNVLPRGDGYGPMPDVNALTNALPAACRGLFVALKNDGTVAIFAGTAIRLYKLSNIDYTWTDVSKGGSAYVTLNPAENWQFAQFGNNVIAVQANANPQVFDITAAAAFSDLGGGPPPARYIATVGRFLVLTGLYGTPYRVQWSGLNSITTWTSGILQSDYQDFPDGGFVRTMAGGEFGVIAQDTMFRRMTFIPGSTVVFQFEKIAENDGIYAPYSLVRVGSRVFYCSPQGFKVIDGTGSPLPIGKERIDRTFFANVDSANLQLCMGAADPNSSRVFWAYKSTSAGGATFDKGLCYDHALDRWTPLTWTGEYLTTLKQPGITLEGLDALAPGIISITGAANNGSGAIRLTLSGLTAGSGSENTNLNVENSVEIYGVVGTTEANGNWRFTIVDSTHIDLIGSTFANAYVSGGSIGGSLDQLSQSLDLYSNASLPQLAMVNGSHKVALFTGANLEATLESSEHGAAPRRIRVRGFMTITDATGYYGRLSYRDLQSAASSLTSEIAVNAIGRIDVNQSCRYARGRIRIPYGASWSYAIGIEPDAMPEGLR